MGKQFQVERFQFPVLVQFLGHPSKVLCSKIVKLFSATAHSPGFIPHHHRPTSEGVDFESFFGRSRVGFESFSSRDSESTRERPKNDSKSTPSEVGRWWWGMNPGGWAVAEKQFHYAKSRHMQSWFLRVRPNLMTLSQPISDPPPRK